MAGADQEIIHRFHNLWYLDRRAETWKDTSWLGIKLQQSPTDLWVYQEIMTRTKPEVFVEVGVKRGGTTLYLAHLFDLLRGDDLERGRVVGVDIDLGLARKHAKVTEHPRVELIEGDSTDPAVFEQVQQRCEGHRTMVLLDSDHRAPHVRAELDLYAELVTPGSYLIVNDTNVNGHPAEWKGQGPGPYEAVADFLAHDDRFAVDKACEKHMLTLSPARVMRRVDEE